MKVNCGCLVLAFFAALASVPSQAALLAIDDVIVSEGMTQIDFTVLLAGEPTSEVFFDIRTRDGSATGNLDFVPKSLVRQLFPGGQISWIFSVTGLDDFTFEPIERFSVEITNAVGATIVDAQAFGTIVDDDAFSTPIPEPTTLALLGLGLAGLVFGRRRRAFS